MAVETRFGKTNEDDPPIQWNWWERRLDNKREWTATNTFNTRTAFVQNECTMKVLVAPHMHRYIDMYFMMLFPCSPYSYLAPPEKNTAINWCIIFNPGAGGLLQLDNWELGGRGLEAWKLPGKPHQHQRSMAHTYSQKMKPNVGHVLAWALSLGYHTHRYGNTIIHYNTIQ